MQVTKSIPMWKSHYLTKLPRWLTSVYSFRLNKTYQIFMVIPTGTKTSPLNLWMFIITTILLLYILLRRIRFWFFRFFYSFLHFNFFLLLKVIVEGSAVQCDLTRFIWHKNCRNCWISCIMFYLWIPLWKIGFYILKYSVLPKRFTGILLCVVHSVEDLISYALPPDIFISKS